MNILSELILLGEKLVNLLEKAALYQKSLEYDNKKDVFPSPVDEKDIEDLMSAVSCLNFMERQQQKFTRIVICEDLPSLDDLDQIKKVQKEENEE